MVSFEYDAEGRIYRILPAYNALQDPGIPIPAFITRLTGITDEMVAAGERLRKAWYKDLPEDQVDAEMLYLNQTVYPRVVGVLPMDRFDAKLRYSRSV